MLNAITGICDEVPMICDAMQQLNDEGLLPPIAFASICHLARSSAYRYYQDTELRISQLNAVLRSAGQQVGTRLLGVVCDGTPFSPLYIDTDLDFDGDGDVDTHDVMGRAIEVNELTTACMKAVHDGVDPDPAVFAQHCDEAINHLFAAKRAVQFITEQRSRRRKAKLTSGVNGKGGRL